MSRTMKNSGVEWIGEIPESWEMKRLKYILKERNEKNDPIKTRDILSLTASQGVIPYAEKEGGGNKPKEDLSAYKLAYPDDVVMNSMNVLSGSVDMSKYYGCVSPVYYMFYSDNPDIDIRYYNYIFKTKAFQRSLMGLGNGILMKETESGSLNTIRMRIPLEKLNRLMFMIPSHEEQLKIIHFLDDTVGEIDNIISKTRSSIEEYKKYRQAVITEAVTKGLTQGAILRDSGCKWIGDIAVSHPLVKLKYVVDILDEFRMPISAEKRNRASDELYDYYGASGAIDKIDGYTIDDHVMLIGEDGANLKMRNLPLMYEVRGKAWINNHAHILKPKNGNDFNYIFMALECLDINPYITGSAQPKLNQENLKEILLPIPEYNEQKEIAKYLQEKVSVINKLIDEKESFISEMENYKKSLIYEFVTGKKNVE